MRTVLMRWCIKLRQDHPRDINGVFTFKYSGYFVSGGPMEAGKTKLSDQLIKLDLVDAIQGESKCQRC